MGPYQPQTLGNYLRYIKTGMEVLRLTNPGARYVVLTDKPTANYLEKYHVECAVVVPPKKPLMLQYIEAQAVFEESCTDDLSVLGATDCMVARDLTDALQPKHRLVVTYRRGPWPINNIGYAKDHDLAAWFLRRALKILEGLPSPMHLWEGDMRAWELALGDWDTRRVLGNSVRLACPEGRKIHLYPCVSHNNFVRRIGPPKSSSRSAYLLHFKGERKALMDEYLKTHIRHWRGWV